MAVRRWVEIGHDTLPVRNPLDSEPQRYEAFLRFFSRDHDRVLAYIQSLLPHRADAEDVFQRCSVLLWRKFDDFDQEREFLPWACGVAFYEVRNFRRVAMRDRLQFDEKLMDQLAERRHGTLRQIDDKLDALRECMNGLKTEDRELLHAAYHDGSTISEVAESTGRALQTLYNRLSILRSGLLKCVQRKLETPGLNPGQKAPGGQA